MGYKDNIHVTFMCLTFVYPLPSLLATGCSTTSGFEPPRKGERVKGSSVDVRITAWYDWLLVVRVLALGAYTYECLRSCLSIGVKNALSIRAKEIGNVFAKTGQIPVRQVPYARGLNDPFISGHESGGSVRDSSAKPDSHTVGPINVRRELNSHAVPMSGVRGMANGAPLFVATVPLTIGKQGYVESLCVP